MICMILLFVHCVMVGFGRDFLVNPEYISVGLVIEILFEALIGIIVACIKDSK